MGLVCGHPDGPVSRILFAIDPVPEVVEEAITTKVDLLVTHHPLLLQPVHSVAPTTWKGRVVHDLIAANVALYCAHTNADVAPGGVSDALAQLLSLQDVRVIAPSCALDAADAGAGLGRWGRLHEPTTLGDFAQAVAKALPTTAAPLRVAGSADARVERVGLCGGAGDSLLEAAGELNLDTFVTADLRHHAVIESALRGEMGLIDPGHWASEWPWLPVAAARLAGDAEAAGTTVDVAVSNQVTDPWVSLM